MDVTSCQVPCEVVIGRMPAGDFFFCLSGAAALIEDGGILDTLPRGRASIMMRR